MPSFVVALEMDEASFGWLNALRRRYFPPARNLLDAHLTLFHTLNAQGVAAIARELGETPWHDIDLAFSGFRSLGRGVAVAVDGPGLVQLRQRLAETIMTQLTAQDRQPFRPHVTIQNKAEPSEAKALLAQLAADFTPRQGAGLAVQIWKYCGGPWRFHARLPQPSSSGTLVHGARG